VPAAQLTIQQVHAQSLLARTIDEVSAYEVLIEAEPGAEPVQNASDLDQ